MRTRSLIAILMMAVILITVPVAAGAEENLTVTVQKDLMLVPYTAQPINPLSEAEMEQLLQGLSAIIINFEQETTDPALCGLITPDDSYWLLSTLLYECPELFHLRTLGVGSKNGVVTKIRFYYHDKWDRESYRQTMEEADAIAEKMTADLDGLGEVEKALLLHDRLAVHCEYAKAEYVAGTTKENPSLYRMVGALNNGKAVCMGYTIAYTFLLRKVGIKVRCCMSEEMNHIWNIVTINGKEYHVDVTFDDPTWDIGGRVRHTNFLRSSAGIYQTGHEYTDYDTTPTDTTYDQYYWQNSTTAFQLINGELYYADNSVKPTPIKRVSDQKTLATVSENWPAQPGYIWPTNYTKLTSDGTSLLFSTPYAIKRLDPVTGRIDTVATPTAPANRYSIFGFTLKEDTLILEFNNTPTFNADTKVDYTRRVAYQKMLTITDVTLLMQFLMNGENPVNKTLLDRNGDGQLTIADSVIIVRGLAA